MQFYQDLLRIMLIFVNPVDKKVISYNMWHIGPNNAHVAVQV